MFGFFRDIALELKGIDTTKAKKERDEKLEQEKLNRFIFSKGVKRTIIILGIIYIPLSILSIVGIISEASYFNADVAFLIIRNIVLMLLSISICVALLIGKKNGEIFALIGSLIFVVLMYLFFILM
jgi:hypothetical protein